MMSNNPPVVLEISTETAEWLKAHLDDVLHFSLVGISLIKNLEALVQMVDTIENAKTLKRITEDALLLNAQLPK
jgi:hypothetical protein